MNMKKHILINGIVSSLLIIAALSIHHFYFTKKIAYIKLNDLHSKFELTKNYEEKAEKATTLKNNMLDSLKLKLEASYRNLQTQKRQGKKLEEGDITNFNLLKQEYAGKREKFDETNQQMLKTFDEQIWTQINTYIIEFGKEKNYDLVLGANGSGSIMYSDEAIDVTNEAIAFINAKHKGN